MLMPEKLEVDLDQVRLEHAPPNPELYGNPTLAGVQATGGSPSIRATWKPLREAGADARTMVVSAAAKRWNVDPGSCRAQSGKVLHAQTGESASYGELAADAALIPVPQNVALKPPKDFTLIGTRAKRFDTPAKVNGTAVFGIDVRPSGVKIATLAQSPVFGGHLKRVDDKAALAVKGVRQIVRLDDAVAVVAHIGRREERISGARHRSGTTGRTPSPSGRTISRPSLDRRRSNRGRSLRLLATSTRPWRAPSRKSRPPTRRHFSPTLRWSR
jgi:isoquinoline 1-oxidoreductase beta subunit